MWSSSLERSKLLERNRACLANRFWSTGSVLLAGREHVSESTNKNPLKAALKSVPESSPVEEKRRNSNVPPLSNMGAGAQCRGARSG